VKSRSTPGKTLDEAVPRVDVDAGVTAAPVTIFRKGLDLKDAVAGSLARDYHSQLVAEIRRTGEGWRRGRLRVHLAKEFGFCYGVDRAVDYAYQARKRFPDQNVYLTGEIIHNPQVNTRLRESGIRFLSDPGESIGQVRPHDVVILPAFGVTIDQLSQLERQGCTLVDTTCGSVLNVWKNVRQYTKAGLTAVIHGKVRHEETQATASQALSGQYLVILDRDEANVLCGFIRGLVSAKELLNRFQNAHSPGFEPDRDLQRIGLANQTTMLMSESLEIGDMIRGALSDRYGSDALAGNYRAFETICSATQDRQDAVHALLAKRIFDLAVVIGGYNSSNTRNLARICADAVPSFHIADASCLRSSAEILYRPTTASPSAPDQGQEIAHDWFPVRDKVTVAVTAGASTPDSIVGDVIDRLGVIAQG
jgi:4-hydroxy-3-methylbut-2-enyl diphosphate reductase